MAKRATSLASSTESSKRPRIRAGPSTNKNTIKELARRGRRDPEQAKKENAKKADKEAIQYQVQQLRKKNKWQFASKDEQIAMEQRVTDEEITKRY